MCFLCSSSSHSSAAAIVLEIPCLTAEHSLYLNFCSFLLAPFLCTLQCCGIGDPHITAQQTLLSMFWSILIAFCVTFRFHLLLQCDIDWRSLLHCSTLLSMFCSILITFSVSFCLHFLVYFAVRWQLEMLNHFLTLLSMFFTFFGTPSCSPSHSMLTMCRKNLVLCWTLWQWCWFLSECFGVLEFCYDKCEP